jgi:tight adherence protein B
MGKLLASEWIIVPLVGICVAVIFYQYEARLTAWLSNKSIGQRDEMFRRLDAMFVDIDKKKITMLIYLLSFGLAGVCLLLLWPNVVLGLIMGSIIGILGWNLPLLYVKQQQEKRATIFVDQMVDGLTIMANGIKAGLSITQAMERVVDNLGEPIAQEFGLVLSQIRIGRSVEEALVELAFRIPKPDVQMFVTAINILKETGGNMGETFETIVTTIRERQKVEKKIQAMTTQGMMQGLIITSVPFMILIGFAILDPSYIKPLFTDPKGIGLLFLMITLQVIGGLMIRSIVSIKV